MVVVKGKKYEQLVGSRAQVGHGTAYKTSYGAVKPRGDALTLKDLKQNKHGRWVSRAKSASAKKDKRLEKAGYFTKKGKFGSFHKSTAKGKKHTRRANKKSKTHKKRGMFLHEKRSASGKFASLF